MLNIYHNGELLGTFPPRQAEDILLQMPQATTQQP